MSELDRAAAACVFAAFRGTVAPEWVLRWIGRGIGGVVLFGRNIESREQVARLTAQLRGEREDLLIATDEEGGDVTRLEGRTGSSYPSAWALGVVDDRALTEQVAAAIAGEIGSIGINLDFAPVADVNSNPDNPVIGVRAFGAEPALVARHVFAFVAGLQRNCVAACAKHFPGHGDTAADSHLELPVAQEAALEPFAAALNAGVRAIMTAHIVVPTLDDAPATLSRRVVQELLREELGYGGVVISDALEMKAVSANMGVEEGAVRALAAGVDALCLGADIDEPLVGRVHAAIVGAVRSGRLPEARVEEAAARVHDLARWASRAAGEPGGDVGAEAARRALRVEGDVALNGDALVIDLRPAASIPAGEPTYGLGDSLTGSRTLTLTDAPPDAAALLDAARPVVVVRDAHRHRWEQETVEALLAAAPDTVVVEVGLPVWRPRGCAYIATHGASRASFAAAAARLRPQNAAV
jgi:beta-N-acetylhexosaminidase